MSENRAGPTADAPPRTEALSSENAASALNPRAPDAPRVKLQVPEGMSKREYKRQLKKAKMEAERPEFIARRNEKRKQLRTKRKLERAELKASGADDSAGSQDGEASSKRHRAPPVPSGVNIILDCGFDELMRDGERTSLARQLTRCYSDNRRCAKSVGLKVTSFNKDLQKRFDENMHGQHHLWKDIEFVETDFEPSDSMLYLSSDSDNVLDRLEPGTTYIVGGIVDKGRYKDLCKNKAEKMGLRTARLPIEESIKLSGRRVLATNHVFELMLRWLEVEDWREAFELVMPTRRILDKPEVDAPDDGITPTADTEAASPPAVSAEAPHTASKAPSKETSEDMSFLPLNNV